MPKREIEGDWILGWADRKRAVMMPSKDEQGRVVYARTPILDLEGLITPIEASYIVAQLAMPDPVHPDDWRLKLHGRVERTLDLDLDTLRRLPGKTVRAVIECAGNDSEFFEYLKDPAGRRKPSLRVKQNETGSAWDQVDKGKPLPDMKDIFDAIPSSNLVSGGEWTGVPLRVVLERAGVGPSAAGVRFRGWDQGKPDPIAQYFSVGRTDFVVHDPGVIHFEKALPIAKAMHPDTILAWAHNGEWLTHVHGAPLRPIVPGWSGNWWVKWIEEIEVVDRLPDLYYQTHYFVQGDSPEDPDKRMLTAMGVKTLIVSPRDEDSPLPRGEHAIRGLAWSGEGKIVRVEVSTDGGATWRDAHVEESPDRWLWVRWSAVWTATTPGDYRIMARAHDETGRVQPQTPPNFQRKHFDGIVPEFIRIE